MRRTQEQVFAALIADGYVKVKDKATDAVAFIKTTEAGQPVAQVFYGKSAKPVSRYRFQTAERREAHIREKFAGRAATLAAKAKRKAEQNKARELEVGDILVESYGYEQSNYNYYQVVELVGSSSVKLRGLNRNVRNIGWCSDMVSPIKDSFSGKEFTKKVVYGDSVKMTSYSYARIWDGKEDNATSYA